MIISIDFELAIPGDPWILMDFSLDIHGYPFTIELSLDIDIHGYPWIIQGL
jgi:hypothetical protein